MDIREIFGRTASPHFSTVEIAFLNVNHLCPDPASTLLFYYVSIPYKTKYIYILNATTKLDLYLYIAHFVHNLLSMISTVYSISITEKI